jgi:putative two-component system response regulator
MIGFPETVHTDHEYFGERARLELLCSAASILVVDDEPMNVELLKRILKRSGFTMVSGLTDPRKVEEFVAAHPPDLVLLDVHMPQRDGFQVLEALSPLIVGERLPVIVVTGDNSTEIRRRALTCGARDFVTKPYDVTEIAIRVRNQLETRLLFHDLRKQNHALSDSVRGRTRELESTRVEMIERIAIAAEYRDDSTNDHNGRVGKIVGMIATMLGHAPADVALAARAATLHDVGKIGIPDGLLRKPGPLTPVETKVMQTHTTIGARILGGSDVPLLRLAETVALTHHERWDGTGYPNGLRREAIPIEGRMVAVADAFDAMISDRPYRRGRSAEEAIAVLRSERDLQFDARVVDALMLCDRAELAGVAAPVYETELSSAAARVL